MRGLCAATDGQDCRWSFASYKTQLRQADDDRQHRSPVTVHISRVSVVLETYPTHVHLQAYRNSRGTTGGLNVWYGSMKMVPRGATYLVWSHRHVALRNLYKIYTIESYPCPYPVHFIAVHSYPKNRSTQASQAGCSSCIMGYQETLANASSSSLLSPSLSATHPLF